MARKFLNKSLLTFGFLSLIHAAFSAAQHRSFLRITEQSARALPIDIIVQALLSLGIIIYNILQIVGDFKEIRAAVDLQQKSWETLSNIPSFYMFCHRGKVLADFDYVPPSQPTGKNQLSSQY